MRGNEPRPSATAGERARVDAPLVRFEIGTQFMSRGKYPRLCTVTDIWRTFNAADELVRVRYVATHQFAGQTLTDYDVVGVTVELGLAAALAAKPKPSEAASAEDTPPGSQKPNPSEVGR